MTVAIACLLPRVRVDMSATARHQAGALPMSMP